MVSRPNIMSSAAGSSGGHGHHGRADRGKSKRYKANPLQPFRCHMCGRDQNKGDKRISIVVDRAENPTGFDHFCRLWDESENTLVRRHDFDSHGTVGNVGISLDSPAATA